MHSKIEQVKRCMCIHHRQSTFNAASGITLKQTPVSQVCNHKSINLHHIQYMNLDCFELYRLSYILLSNYDLQSQLCQVSIYSHASGMYTWEWLCYVYSDAFSPGLHCQVGGLWVIVSLPSSHHACLLGMCS